MYPIRIPFFTKLFYPNVITQIRSSEKTIYLTFDDGPIPEVTPWVLEQLEQYNAKATFFCIGDNVQKHPDIFTQLLEQGHTVGNHTFHHLNGWNTSVKEYIENIRKCAEVVKSDLFRPPYGRITRKQYKALSQQYKIVLWHILSGDFDKNLSAGDCYNNVIKHATDGSLIVFHDSLKAQKNLQLTLPMVLEYLSNAGFRFASLPSVKNSVLYS